MLLKAHNEQYRASSYLVSLFTIGDYNGETDKLVKPSFSLAKSQWKVSYFSEQYWSKVNIQW